MAVILNAAAVALATLAAYAEVSVTVYNQDLGLVREIRELEFPAGVGEVRFTDVAEQILPTSVHFHSESAVLLEQNFEYDLVSAEQLLSKYVERGVEITTIDKAFFAGKLLTSGGDLVIQESDGSIRSLARSQVANVHFPDLPEGLITRPTLVWLVRSSGSRRAPAEISYLTRGMTWAAEYVAVVDKSDERLSLAGWVNITNNSGATYRDAEVKLMAGDVQIRSSAKQGRDYGVLRRTMVEEAGAQFAEQPFYEYHLYTLQRRTTLANHQVKQIALFPTVEAKVSRQYRFEDDGSSKVKVVLETVNSSKNGLGMPLPKGLVRVYKEADGGALQFVGEDAVDHTPQDEKVRISTGYAFDVAGERTRTDFKRRGDGREEAYEVKIRNRKTTSVQVTVAANLWGDWTLLEDTTPGWVKKSANLVEWTVKIEPGEEAALTYRVFTR